MEYESEDNVTSKNIIDRLFSRLSLRHLRAINIKEGVKLTHVCRDIGLQRKMSRLQINDQIKLMKQRQNKLEKSKKDIEKKKIKMLPQEIVGMKRKRGGAIGIYKGFERTPSLLSKSTQKVKKSDIPAITLTPCAKQGKGFLSTLLEEDDLNKGNQLQVPDFVDMRGIIEMQYSNDSTHIPIVFSPSQQTPNFNKTMSRRSRVAILKVKQKQQAKSDASREMMSLHGCRYLRGPIENTFQSE